MGQIVIVRFWILIKRGSQFDVLEETYFKAKSMSAMQLLKLQNQALVEVDEKVEHIDSRVTNLENTTTVDSSRKQYTLKEKWRVQQQLEF